MSGADEFLALAADFKEASAGVARALRTVYSEGGEAFRDDWRDNVRAVAPNHLPHLPDAITSELVFAGFALEVEVGPESGRRQGALGRGDEFGSRNQPPHLSGQKAIPAAEKRLERGADAAIAFLIP